MEQRRQQTSGDFELPLPAAEAMWLFTPEGEREWVPDWEPRYPTGQPSEEPGTVFRTNADGVTTVWVILELDRAGHRASYARVTPGVHAGTVSVECTDTRPGHCRVTIGYDLTTLGDVATLDPYRPEAFATMMHSWAELTTKYLSDRSG
jgi:hypothetical protein